MCFYFFLYSGFSIKINIDPVFFIVPVLLIMTTVTASTSPVQPNQSKFKIGDMVVWHGKFATVVEIATADNPIKAPNRKFYEYMIYVQMTVFRTSTLPVNADELILAPKNPPKAPNDSRGYAQRLHAEAMFAYGMPSLESVSAVMGGPSIKEVSETLKKQREKSEI